MSPNRTSTSPWAPLLICGALVLLLGQPVLAQSAAVVPTDTGLSVELAGHRVTMPVPVWTVASDEPIEQAQTLYTALEDNVDSLVLLPIDETVVTWTKLMGVLAVNQPGYPAAAQVASIVEPITEACTPNALAATNFEREDGEGTDTILLMCGRYKVALVDVPRKCGGGIILAAVVQSPMGAAKIYYEWCTGSFDVDDHAQWPVSEADLGRYAAALRNEASYVPLPAAPPG